MNISLRNRALIRLNNTVFRLSWKLDGVLWRYSRPSSYLDKSKRLHDMTSKLEMSLLKLTKEAR